MTSPILIVDDNAVNLKVLRLTLSVEGYDVRTAIDAEQAIEILATFHPRLILMDLQLPGMDGLALTRRLKQDPATQHVIVVAVTAFAMKSDEERALAAGCDGYVSKPIDTDAIVVTVAQLLGGSA
jgi:CheY-like chemotaxis protein